jgi:uncharacterized membrane protein
MLLALTVWLGGLVFFAFVLAPTAFSPGLLPSRHLAGSIVGISLDKLHFMAIASGIVFLVSSLVYNRLTTGESKPPAARHMLVVAMLLLTSVSQFVISPRMRVLRVRAGVMDDLPAGNPIRTEFDRLHFWSENFEVVVLLIGVATLYAVARNPE